MSLLELFCDVDDFMLKFAPQWKASQVAAGKQRERTGQLCASEVMTILIHFHQSHYRTFKAYYTEHVQVHLTQDFPHLVSYTRFVALIPGVLLPLLAYLQHRYGPCTGISFIDSTSLSVCDPKRISQHRVFATDARRGKTSMGWFYGFKLHLAVNDRGDLLACCLTAGNVDDRTPVPQLVKRLRGKLFGDRGYISAPLTQLLFEQGLQLITKLRKNMKNQLMPCQISCCCAKERSSSPSLTSSRTFRRSSIRGIAVPPILWCICLPGSLPTVIKTKNRACISMHTLCWPLDRPCLSRTHVKLHNGDNRGSTHTVFQHHPRLFRHP